MATRKIVFVSTLLITAACGGGGGGGGAPADFNVGQAVGSLHLSVDDVDQMLAASGFGVALNASGGATGSALTLAVGSGGGCVNLGSIQWNGMQYSTFQDCVDFLPGFTFTGYGQTQYLFDGYSAMSEIAPYFEEGCSELIPSWANGGFLSSVIGTLTPNGGGAEMPCYFGAAALISENLSEAYLKGFLLVTDLSFSQISSGGVLTQYCITLDPNNSAALPQGTVITELADMNAQSSVARVYFNLNPQGFQNENWFWLTGPDEQPGDEYFPDPVVEGSVDESFQYPSYQPVISPSPDFVFQAQQDLIAAPLTPPSGYW